MTVAQDGLDGGDTGRQLDDAHRQLLTDNSIQFELPTGLYPAGQGPVSQSPPSTGPSTDPMRAPPQQGPSIQADPSTASPPAPAPELSGSGPGGLDGLMQVFLWVAAGVALAILLYWLFAFFRDRGPGGREASARHRTRPEQEGWRPAESEAVQLLDEADMLANEGRYDEAARLLLHRSIGEIAGHRPELVRPALTSRDIAGHPLLPSGPAAAFARIAALVERSLFARRPLVSADWEDCRAAYREFAFPGGWQG